jgi:ArsR family transcriptional regulator
MAFDETAQCLQIVFGALADPLRARIMCLLAEHELCVGYLVEVLQTIQPVISRQLSVLREMGLASARREGKWVHYSLVRPSNQAAATVLNEALRQLKRVRQIQRDSARLSACSHHRTGILKHAPVPQRITR